MSPNYLKEFYKWCSVPFFLPISVTTYNCPGLGSMYVQDIWYCRSTVHCSLFMIILVLYTT